MFGLIGKKLSHSFSKEIHERIYNAPYNLIELDQLDSFFTEKKFKGVNVTIPYKKDVMKYLDVLSDSAKVTGSVNTIINNNGILIGYNTDYDGLSYLLKYNSISLVGKSVLILGNGATSGTISSFCFNLGASEVIITARNPLQGEHSFNDAFLFPNTQIVFNATPVGMYPNSDDSTLIDLSQFQNLETVIDLVYNPLRTRLVQTAENLGKKAVNGLLMLVHQAVKSCELFHNKIFSDKITNEIYHEILFERVNFVLVGMPMSGKTHYAKRLSSLYQKEYVDIDYEIEDKYEMSISDYFQNYGEAAFRIKESEIIKNISILHNKAISTGGGSILDEKNIYNLKQNGIIIFLDASLDLLKTCNPKNRPLLKDQNNLVNLYNKRHSLYKNCADITIHKDIFDSDILLQMIEVKIHEYFNS